MSPWIKSQSVTIQMKAAEQYFPVALFIMQNKVVKTLKSAEKGHTCSKSSCVSLPERVVSTSLQRSKVNKRSIFDAGGQGCAAASRKLRQSINSVSKASTVLTS